jgi:hypothetical protein
MAAVSLGFEVGDTVYVNYPFPDSLYFDPQTRVVSQIKLTAAAEVAVISFTSGNSVNYSDASPTCYTTVILAAVANLDNVISRSAATCVLDTGSTSVASTASQTFSTLGRASA